MLGTVLWCHDRNRPWLFEVAGPPSLARGEKRRQVLTVRMQI